MGELIPISAIVGFFTAVILVVWFVARTIQYQSTVRTKLLDKLFDKFGTAEEFATFAQSDAGDKLIDAVSGGRRPERSQMTRSIRRGVIASALGLGGVLLALIYAYDFIWAGVLLLALGAGFLVSAYITRRLEEEGRELTNESTSEELSEAFPE